MDNNDIGNFYKKLIDETLVSTGYTELEMDHHALHDYFVKRSNLVLSDKEKSILNEKIEKIVQVGVTVFHGRYLRESRCFRLAIPGGVLDFPENWEIFSEISPATAELQRYLLDENSDKQSLLDVLCPFVSYDTSLLFLFEGQMFKLVFIPRGDTTMYNSILSLISDNTPIAA